MLINANTLRSLYTGFSAAFAGGFAGAASVYDRVATRVPSTTSENEYGWLGQIPGFREWIGDRHIQSMAVHDYALKNKPFEMTIGVNRDHIEDDNLGIYAPMFSEMGRAGATFPNELVFGLLKDGFSQNCYDGQYFFDTDHPVINEDGSTGTVSNTGGGSGTPWFLLDTSRALKPLIFQDRKPFNKLVRMDADTDEAVFSRKEFRYGVDGRCNVGFGFWQMAYGSKQTLNAAAYAAARAAMGSLKADRNGKPLGIMPNLLVVPPELESAGRKILNSEYAAGGETNEWKGTAELLVVPWLA